MDGITVCGVDLWCGWRGCRGRGAGWWKDRSEREVWREGVLGGRVWMRMEAAGWKVGAWRGWMEGLAGKGWMEGGWRGWMEGLDAAGFG